MTDLSILIPARNEIFLNRTIEDILAHATADTEVIVVLDGAWPAEPIQDHERVRLVYHSEPIGQRAACNEAARLANGRYLLKVDAHCSFAPGFDAILLEDMRHDWTCVPVMRNLHAFDWVCPDGHRRYQGPSGPCQVCGKPTTMDVVWIAKRSPQSTSYRFDREPHFQYFNEYRAIGDHTASMSLQGSCFMLARDNWFNWNVCDESWGSWGSQGIEVAFKTWQNRGEVICNRRTWYAHLFRTQGGDFGFPYELSGRQVEHAKSKARELVYGDPYTLQRLLTRFGPVLGWEDYQECVDQTGAIIYYTCNTHRPEIDEACREQLSRSGLPIVSVSLNKDLAFGETRLRMDGERGPLMMHRQILAGLEACDADYVFLCESDVLYHPSHFAFSPPDPRAVYYNTNVWRARYPDGHAIWTDDLQQVSGLCANRRLLIEWYRAKIAQIEAGGFDGHYEPGVRQSIKLDGLRVANRASEQPNVCIRHDSNLTRSKWRPEDYRNKKFARGWKESDEVPGWGRPLEVIDGGN